MSIDQLQSCAETTSNQGSFPGNDGSKCPSPAFISYSDNAIVDQPLIQASEELCLDSTSTSSLNVDKQHCTAQPLFQASESNEELCLDHASTSSLNVSEQRCTAQCCHSDVEAYQPTDSPTVSLLSVKKRNFNVRWYSIYPWLTVCATTKKVYCLYCRYGYFRNMLQLVKTGEKAFTSLGFNNWKKALEKFKAHELSHAHKEAKLKWIAKGKETVATPLSSQLQQEQRMRRDGLLFN